MRRNLSRLLPLCLLITACGTSSRQQALLERREAIRASNAAEAAETFRTFRSKGGFATTQWGMSPDEVRALYPDVETISRGDLRARGEVMQRPATLEFYFVEEKLAAVKAEFELSSPARDEFTPLSRSLSRKYGAPVVHKDSAADAEKALWNAESSNRRTETSARLREVGGKRRASDVDPVSTEDRQDEEEARLAVERSQYEYSLRDEWKDSETELRLLGEQDSRGGSLVLQYRSWFLKSYLRD